MIFRGWTQSKDKTTKKYNLHFGDAEIFYGRDILTPNSATVSSFWINRSFWSIENQQFWINVVVFSTILYHLWHLVFIIMAFYGLDISVKAV